MAVISNTRDNLRNRIKGLPVNFYLQGLGVGFSFLPGDNDIGKIACQQRDRTQPFTDVSGYPVTHVILYWIGADPVLNPGRNDRIEVRIAKRQANGSAVIAWYMSAPYAGLAGAQQEMIIPLTGSLPDQFPVDAFLQGTIDLRSDLADPGAWVIDRVLLAGGPVPQPQAGMEPTDLS